MNINNSVESATIILILQNIPEITTYSKHFGQHLGLGLINQAEM